MRPMRILRSTLFVKGIEMPKTLVSSQMMFKSPDKSGYCTENANETPTKPCEFKVIYRLPAIRMATTVNRLKLDMTYLAGICFPSSILCSQLNVISSGMAYTLCVFCGVGCLALHTLGLICNRVIGAVYISSDSTLAKVSYCDYWGRRKDLVCPVSDIVRLSELEDKITDPYITFRRYSTTETFRLSIRYGSVLDMDNFIIVLGHPKSF